MSAPITASEALRNKLMHAAIDCGHSITHNEIILYHDETQEGNTLHQLAERLLHAVHESASVEASTDPIVEMNVTMLRERSALGVAKYETTLADSKLPLRAWLTHALEETLDNANYLQAAMQTIDAAPQQYAQAEELRTALVDLSSTQRKLMDCQAELNAMRLNAQAALSDEQIDEIAAEHCPEAIVTTGSLRRLCRAILATRQPAPVAVKDHVLREVVNSLRDIAIRFHDTQQLRERLRRCLDPLLVAPVAAAVQGEPDAVFAEFCDREGFPSDGPFDAALRKAFDAGVTMMVSHACRNASQPSADAAPAIEIDRNNLQPGRVYIAKPAHDPDSLDWWNGWQPARFVGYKDGQRLWNWIDAQASDWPDIGVMALTGDMPEAADAAPQSTPQFELGKIYVCRVNVRPEFKGRKALAEVAALNGSLLLLELAWHMGDDEKYPDEAALQRADDGWIVDGKSKWIASGDVEVLGEVNPDFVARRTPDAALVDAKLVLADQPNSDFRKCLRSFAMSVAEAGIKEGSGRIMSVASDRCRAVVNGVMEWEIGKGLIYDLLLAAQRDLAAQPSPAQGDALSRLTSLVGELLEPESKGSNNFPTDWAISGLEKMLAEREQGGVPLRVSSFAALYNLSPEDHKGKHVIVGPISSQLVPVQGKKGGTP